MTDDKVFDSCEDTYVYANEAGSVSIVQSDHDIEDKIIVIPLEHIEKIVSALRKAKKDAKTSRGHEL